jgi:hypothetical protein
MSTKRAVIEDGNNFRTSANTDIFARTLNVFDQNSTMKEDMENLTFISQALRGDMREVRRNDGLADAR